MISRQLKIIINYWIFPLFFVLPTQTFGGETRNPIFHGGGYPVIICDKTYIGKSANCKINGNEKALLVKGNLISNNHIYIGGNMLILPDGKISQLGCEVPTHPATTLDCPGTLISAGFINLHEHIEYSYYTPRALPTKHWQDRNEWRAATTTQRGFKDQKPATSSLRTIASERAMLRHLLSGTTALAGAEKYSAFSRNLGVVDGLSGTPAKNPIDYATFPFKSPVLGLSPCDYTPAKGLTLNAQHAYVPHVGEGIDKTAWCEIDNMLYGLKNQKSSTALIHMIPVDQEQIKQINRQHVSIVVSPRSNFELYGKTIPIQNLAHSGVNLALGTDWSVTGSLTMLDEMRCLADYNRKHLNSVLTWADLHRMMTSNAAHAVGLQDKLGGLFPNAIADFVIIDTKGARSLGDILKNASLAEITAVFIAGRGGVFPANWDRKLPWTLDNCSIDPRHLCGQSRIVCGANSARSLSRLLDSDIYTINDDSLCHPQSVDVCSPS